VPKCDAARPACGYCRSANITCSYTTKSETETRFQALKRKLAETHERAEVLLQIHQHIRDRPEPESNEIVKRIRAGADPECIARYIREGDLLLQLALVPESRYRYVFPLLDEMPAFLIRPDNPYLDSWVYEGVLGTGSSANRELTLSSKDRFVELPSPFSKPYHAAEVVEPLLSTIKPSEWTTVLSDDVLMRKMLADYFLSNYEWTYPFQKDYFLQDMAAGHGSCCSSLLVNAVLAFASVSKPLDHFAVARLSEVR
jgi:hypothetical protein